MSKLEKENLIGKYFTITANEVDLDLIVPNNSGQGGVTVSSYEILGYTNDKVIIGTAEELPNDTVRREAFLIPKSEGKITDKPIY